MIPSRLAAAATACAAGLMLAIQVVGRDLATDVAPLGLVALQFTSDPAEVAAILAGWTGPLRRAALLAHGLDLLLPCAYGVAIAAAGRALAEGRARGTALARTARRAGRAGIAVAVLDQVENAAVALTLLVGPGAGRAIVTVIAAAGKWFLLAAALAGLARVRLATPTSAAGPVRPA